MTISRTGSDRRGRDAGFTLIEVLVTCVILFAGLGAVLKAYSLAVVALEASADVVAASALLGDKAAELELKLLAARGQGLPGGGGVVAVDGVDYRWEARCQLQTVSPCLKIQKALLSARRAAGGIVRTLDCEWTLVCDPSPGGAR